MDIDAIILSGKVWVVKGELSSEAILSSIAQGIRETTTGDLLLTTGTIGDGKAAAQAALALQQSGLSGIIAPAFHWHFFRVCVNVGLPPLTLWEAGEIRQGDRLRVDLTGQVVKDLSSGMRYPIRDLPDLYVEILACGGMAGYVRALREERRSLANLL